MFVVEIFIPLKDGDGKQVSRDFMKSLQIELTEQFGGVTGFTRSPAEGRWKDESDRPVTDAIVILEVIVPELSRDWWQALRRRLEHKLRQDKVLLRATAIEIL